MSYSRANIKKGSKYVLFFFLHFLFFFFFQFHQSKQINLRLTNANGWRFHAQLERMSHPCYGVIPVTFALARAQDKSVCA